MNHKHITYIIKQRMIVLGINQTRLAKEYGCSRVHISRILNHKTNLTINSLNTIATVLQADFIIALKPKEPTN